MTFTICWRTGRAACGGFMTDGRRRRSTGSWERPTRRPRSRDRDVRTGGSERDAERGQRVPADGGVFVHQGGEVASARDINDLGDGGIRRFSGVLSHVSLAAWGKEHCAARA